MARSVGSRIFALAKKECFCRAWEAFSASDNTDAAVSSVLTHSVNPAELCHLLVTFPVIVLLVAEAIGRTRPGATRLKPAPTSGPTQLRCTKTQLVPRHPTHIVGRKKEFARSSVSDPGARRLGPIIGGSWDLVFAHTQRQLCAVHLRQLNIVCVVHHASSL